MTAFYLGAKTDRGGVTAEFAVLMPTFVGLLVLLIGLAVQQERVLSAQDKLASLARLVESGATLTAVESAGERFGLVIKPDEFGGLVCLNTKVPVKVVGVVAFQQGLKACGLAPGN